MEFLATILAIGLIIGGIYSIGKDVREKGVLYVIGTTIIVILLVMFL